MGYEQTFPGRSWEFTDNLVRVGIDAYKLKSQDLNAREGNQFSIESVDDGYFEFLVVDTLFEQLSHNWEPFNSMAGKAANVLQKNMDIATDTGGLIGGTGVPATRFKFDTPLIYTGSERRKLNLTVNLRDQGNPGALMNCVTQLKEMSSPKIGDQGEAIAKLDYPYVFEIQTIPEAFIFFNFAALRSIQATYLDFQSINGIITGYPTAIDLVLEFEDMEPLYESSFKHRAAVTAE